MPYVYLGFIDTLRSVLQGIFDKVLSPVLETVFFALLDLLGGFLWELLSELMMDIFIILLKAVNFLNNMFSLFSGIALMQYNKEEISLIEFVFQLDGVSSALAVMTMLGAAMAFIFAIYSTGKSMADAPFEDNSKPISHVLKNGFRAAVTFMVVPFMCVFVLRLSTAVLDQTIISFQSIYEDGENTVTGMDDTLFITAAQGAAKGNKDIVIKTYSSNHKYADREQVSKDFDVSKVNYVVGFAGSILVLLILLGSCLEFIRRIFDVVILYLVSPFFTATIALDGGARFKKWQDLFVAKFFSGFGAIFAMKIYIMVSPVLMSGSIKFSADGETDMIMKMFLVIGGAWAVYKGQHLMLQILNPEVASAAGMSGGVMAALVAKGAGGIAKGAAGAAKKGINSSMEKQKAKSQAYQGGKG